MRIRVSALALACGAVLSAQHHRFSWQDACFKNPGAPYCQGHDVAVKPAPKRDTTPRSVASNPFASTQPAAPALIEVGDIDWRFATPSADVLIGFNMSEIAASPIVKKLMAHLRAGEGIFEVDHMAISVRGNQLVAMITGPAAESALPPPAGGTKALPIPGGAMLIGDADEVDRAAQRIASKADLSELGRIAADLQSTSDFWAVASAPQRCTLQVRIGDRLTSDLACGHEGQIVHTTSSIEANEVERKLSAVIAGPHGRELAAFIRAAQYLPARPAPDTKGKAVIYGLDDGPKVVN